MSEADLLLLPGGIWMPGGLENICGSIVRHRDVDIRYENLDEINPLEAFHEPPLHEWAG
jgi:hypothetical protein